jgi:hypothetical protein
MTNPAPSRRSPWPLLVIIAILAVGVWWFTQPGEPSGETATPESDGLTYVQRVTPLVETAERLAATLETTNSLALKLAAAAELRARWPEVRTAAGYDRATHDGFILTFTQFLSALKASEDLLVILDLDSPDGAGIPENRRLEAAFLLQGLHGAETAEQLVSRTGLTREELLSRTNLQAALALGLQKAIATSAKARQVLEQLQAAEVPPAGGK